MRLSARGYHRVLKVARSPTRCGARHDFRICRSFP